MILSLENQSLFVLQHTHNEKTTYKIVIVIG